MEQKQERPNGKDSEGIDLIEFSIVLVATSNNPSILNPDFLFHNDIVDVSHQVRDPRISTPAFSQVTFEDGLTVKVQPGSCRLRTKGEQADQVRRSSVPKLVDVTWMRFPTSPIALWASTQKAIDVRLAKQATGWQIR